MMRLGPIVALMLVFSASVPATAQNLVSPKLLPTKPSLHVGVRDLNAALSQDLSPQTNHPALRRHWTTGGKVLTFVGAGLAVTGTVVIVHAANNPQDWFVNYKKAIGIGMVAGGSVVTIIGVTRRSKN